MSCLGGTQHCTCVTLWVVCGVPVSSKLNESTTRRNAILFYLYMDRSTTARWFPSRFGINFLSDAIFLWPGGGQCEANSPRTVPFRTCITLICVDPLVCVMFQRCGVTHWGRGWERSRRKIFHATNCGSSWLQTIRCEARVQTIWAAVCAASHWKKERKVKW